MELSAAAAYFDLQPVYDAYTDAELFRGQLDLHDLTERDSATGWRRTVSASAIPVLTRGCIRVGSDRYIAGRVTSDFFQSAVVRQYVLLHPVDELFTYGAATEFLDASVALTAYASKAWVKESRDAELSSQTIPVFDLFVSATEASAAGQVWLDEAGVYYRAQAASEQTGGLQKIFAYSLGADAKRTVSYIAAGSYSPTTDTSAQSAPVSISALVEPYRVNYTYRNNAAHKFERADRVVTVLATDVAAPTVSSGIVDGSVTYRVLEALSTTGGWELHVRPV